MAETAAILKAENHALRIALAELVLRVEEAEEHSPAQRDEHYEDDCPICVALTEAVAALTGNREGETG